MSKSYGNSTPSFFVSLCNNTLPRVQEAILEEYHQVSIYYETININATVNPKNYLYRKYHEELSNIQFLQGVYLVYPKEKENSNVDAEDILFIGRTLRSSENSLTYFYEYDHKGCIPELLDICQACNVFHKLCREKGYSHLIRPDEFMNKYSILCIVTDSDKKNSISYVAADLLCRIREELLYFSDQKIKTICDILFESRT